MSDFIINTNRPAPRALTALDRTIGLENPTLDIDQAGLTDIKANHLLKIDFTRADLLALLRQEDCAGLRIYPAFDSNGNFSMLAVATDSSRVDIVSGDTSKCFVAQDGKPATRLTQTEATNMIQDVKAHIMANSKDSSDLIPFATAATSTDQTSSNYSKVFFTSTDMMRLLGSDAVGIRFYTSKIKFSNRGQRTFPTLTAVALSSTDVESSIGLLSALPCPPNCGGGYVGDSDSVRVSA